MDCVRELKRYYEGADDLYDVLCEAVHPNWLGVSRFREVGQDQDEITEYEIVMCTTIIRALLLGHEVTQTIGADLEREAIAVSKQPD